MPDTLPQDRDRHIPGLNGLQAPPPTMAADGSALIPESELDAAPGMDNVVEQEDGSALVIDEQAAAAAQAKEEDTFYENLAEKLPPDRRASIAIELLDLLERDKESREKRDQQYAEGLRRTGLGDEKPKPAPFEGATEVVHPVLAEACIDFASRAIRELLPPGGPVKTHVIGKKTEAALQRADRKRRFMNYQITGNGPHCIREYRGQVEQLLTQLPLGGSQFLKVWHDARYKRPRVEFIPVDDLRMPSSASSFFMCPRTTHVQKVTRAEFEERVATKLYVEPDFFVTPAQPDATAAAAVASSIEGKTDTGYNEDGERIVYEVYLDYALEEDEFGLNSGMTSPYIVTIDETTKQIIGWYRNWAKKDDESHTRLEWIVDFGFLPWRGAFALGLAHIIGSLSGALTGGVRALLDSAHVNNFPGGVKLKGSRVHGQSKTVEPLTFHELEGPANIDDIRKLAMPFPVNPPSAVLLQLVQWLSEQAKGVVSTAEEKISEASNDMPVGTALALIEQGSVNFSSIHSRLHDSQARVLAIFHRLNADYMDDEMVVAELGDMAISRSDFQGPVDVVPVSDPRIFSETQRLGQFQAMIQLKTDPDFNGMFNKAKLLRRGLTMMNVADYEDVLELPPEPEKLDPITENTVAALGKQRIQVYPDQDHFTHLVTHLAFATSPMFGANPLMQGATMVLAAHIKEHLVYLYAQHMLAATQSVEQVAAMMGAPEQGEELIVKAVSVVEQTLAQRMGPHIMPMLQKMLQTIQQAQAQAQQAAPMDPAKVTLQLGQADLARQSKKDDADSQFKMLQAQMEDQRAKMSDQLELALTQIKESASTARNDANNEAKLLVQGLQQRMADLDRALAMIQHITPPAAPPEPAGAGSSSSGQEG